MSNYQNYYPQMNMNNNPYGSYQMQPNPYMDRMMQLQQFQQNLQQPMNSQQLPTIGKIVENIDMVKTMDIPMDGSVYYFPKADGTEIYSKKWLPNGQTQIMTYRPMIDDSDINNNVQQNDLQMQINVLNENTSAFLKSIDERLEKIEKNFVNAKKNSVKAKENEVQ